MSNFKFLVEVETEREQGKFASRDEQSEAIAAALADGAEMAELTGIGSDSSSDYAVNAVDVTELDNKELKALWKDNERVVAEQTPSEIAARRIRKEQSDRLKQLERENANLKQRLEDIKTLNKEHNETRIYIVDYSTDIPVYIRDDKPIQFDLGNGGHINVKLVDDKLEIAYQGFEGLNLRPQASNVVLISQGGR